MDKHLLTPQRQKMLIGGGAAGLLLILGFAFAPDVDVAEPGSDEQSLLAELDQDDSAFAQRRSRFRAKRTSTLEPDATVTAQGKEFPIERDRAAEQPQVAEHDRAAAIVIRPRTPEKEDTEKPALAATRGSDVPPAYQQRLALLQEEEQALTRQLQRQRAARPQAGPLAPVPTVTVASVEAVGTSENPIQQAVAEHPGERRSRQVELVGGQQVRPAAGDGPRGAWLSGSIEIP